MSDTNPFAEYTARLREFIAASVRDSKAGGTSFQELALELFELQFAHNAPYRRLCEARRVTPPHVEHWSRIPAIPTSAFKELELSSLPAEQRTAVFHSSGTTEQRPSRHFHSAESLAIYEASLLPWFRRHVCPENSARMPVLSLTPPPAQVPHSSLVHMFATIHREVGTRDSAFFGVAGADGSWSLDSERAVEALQQAAAKGHPVLLLGTAFSYVYLLDFLAAQDLRLELTPGSRAMETGGYKGRSRVLPKAELHALISERLALPATQIICEYGMSELSSQAYDRSCHASSVLRSSATAEDGRITHRASPFLFPPWARVQLISPETGREVADGETGLVRIFDLANVYSVMALQTEDLGVRRGEGLELLGRAALAEPRGCSLMAR